MLTRLAAESGVETPSDDGLRRLDRGRKAKKLGNAEWTNSSDPEARITRMEGGATRLAYMPEHAIDLVTGAVVSRTSTIRMIQPHKAAGGGAITLPR